ncbi:MAG: DUF2130 domain-containing protein [Gammaproteobacteria bacterium]|nr:DUF2130 domain-containing protein [Gammaproteobacteria bacterium]MYG66140.1 DUF2130 domain-containing protein [Gammaproteobacteria bacterium]
MADDSGRIQCPNCGQEIDVNDVLAHRIENRLRGELEAKHREQEEQVRARMEEVGRQQAALQEAQERQARETEEAIALGIKEREAELAQQLKCRLESEQEDKIGSLERELGEKNEKLKAFHRAQADIARLKREKDELSDVVQAEAEKKLTREREQIKRSLEEKARLDMAERDKVISDLNRQLQDAQRRAEQGSTQLQGEVQELAIEDWLRARFPLDTVEEIKKGARGADCLQTVHTRSRQNCGTIYYESKRAKAFQPGWIEKFRQDIREKGADAGVLVTQTMPPDMDGMGQRDGIWICSFEEFGNLAVVLRDGIIRLSEAVAARENRGDKMGMLYDYLTGNEFRQQVEAIVEGFTQMQTDLESEKRSMQTIWKKREKQIEKVLLSTNHMYGSIRGIAGNTIPQVSLLELDDEAAE